MIAGVIGSVVALCVFAGGVAGLLLDRALPARLLTKEATDIARLGAGMVSGLAALVLGLLVATARDSLDTADLSVHRLSADLVQTDQALGAYEPETARVRGLLRRYAAAIRVPLGMPSTGPPVP